MTDDISKVVREMRYSATNWKCGSGVSAVVAAEQAVEWANRLESATIPAEVDGEAASDDSIIARCEAVGIKWLEPDNVLPDGTIDLEGFPGSFDMATMQEMRALLADYATLARQLAEAKAENERLKGLNSQLVNKSNTQVIELARLEEALAAATRRVAEVEKEAATERALQRAAKELPEGWDVCVYVEQGSGWVELRNPDLDTVEFDRDDYNLAEQIESATDAALQKEPK